MSKQLQIRNSTAEFLIFQAEDKAEGVQVFYKDESIWATQEAIAILFDKGRSTITEHLGNIYQSGELDVNTTCRKFRHMGSSGQEYETKYYNLDAPKIVSSNPIPPKRRNATQKKHPIPPKRKDTIQVLLISKFGS